MEEHIYDILFGDAGEYSKSRKLHYKLMRKINGESIVSTHIHKLWNEMFDMEDKTSEKFRNIQRLMNKLYMIQKSLEKDITQTEFDKTIIEANIAYYEELYISYSRRHEHASYIITPKNHTVRRLSKTACRTLEKETCSICLDTHGHKDIVKTSCGHIFGKSCFQQHLKAINPSDHEDAPLRTCCPMCRTTNLSMTLFAKKIRK